MSDDFKKYNNSLRYAGLATQWMVLMLLAVWGGYKLDKITGWKFPIFIVLFPVLALIYSLWKIIKEFNKPKND